MDGEDAVGPPFVDERQPVEQLGGGQPDELGRGDRDRRPQLPLELPAHGRVCAVGADDQVVAPGQAGGVGDVVLEPEVDPGRLRLLVQEAQQRHPGDGRHPVAAAAPPLAVDPDLDLVPVDAVVGQRPQQHRVDVVDAPQGGVGEDDPETEGVARPVAFEDDDVGRRVGQLQQGGGEEASGAPADDGGAHPINVAY